MIFDKVIEKFRILPLLILVASFAFAIRFADVFMTSHQMDAPLEVTQNLRSNAFAQDETSQGDTAQGDISQDSAESEESPSASSLGSPPWVDSSGTDFEYSEVTAELFETLVERRKAIEVREAEIEKKEALLDAARQEINDKYQELSQMRNEIQDLLQQQTEEERARIGSLVKVYEGMKAKDAAQIFNTLDMDILIDVMGLMSERKMAPILAEMDPDRARSVTVFLAEEKKLPTLPN